MKTKRKHKHKGGHPVKGNLQVGWWMSGFYAGWVEITAEQLGTTPGKLTERLVEVALARSNELQCPINLLLDQN